MNEHAQVIPHPSSYRDPSGFIFSHNSKIYRQVNLVYKENFDHLIASGLYDHLTGQSLLIPHQQILTNFTGEREWYTTLEPAPLPFISYPFEWSFSMLKDAALLTLLLMEKSMEYGMILKDANPYNVQILNGRMIFIDTLSFEKYDETKPWVAYRQFCENFLAPLALMHYGGVPLTKLFLAYPEGIPLDLASSMLPFIARWNIHIQLHIYLNNRVSKENKKEKSSKPFSKKKLVHILASLRSAVESFHLNYKGSWWNYYTEAEQRADYLFFKKEIIQNWLKRGNYRTAFDAGANDGTFSELLAAQNIMVISADTEHYAIDKLYNSVKEKAQTIYPLIVDLANPSPATGINNLERYSLVQRLSVDLVIALAVIHHLCVGKNIPFHKTAQFFKGLGKTLIIEFVPREDEKVTLMLEEKKDVYQWYTQESFEETFRAVFFIESKEIIQDSVRTIYLMKAL